MFSFKIVWIPEADVRELCLDLWEPLCMCGSHIGEPMA